MSRWSYIWQRIQNLGTYFILHAQKHLHVIYKKKLQEPPNKNASYQKHDATKTNALKTNHPIRQKLHQATLPTRWRMRQPAYTHKHLRTLSVWQFIPWPRQLRPVTERTSQINFVRANTEREAPAVSWNTIWRTLNLSFRESDNESVCANAVPATCAKNALAFDGVGDNKFIAPALYRRGKGRENTGRGKFVGNLSQDVMNVRRCHVKP